MRKLLLTISLFACAAAASSAQEAVRAWEGTIDMQTYIGSAPESAP